MAKLLLKRMDVECDEMPEMEMETRVVNMQARKKDKKGKSSQNEKRKPYIFFPPSPNSSITDERLMLITTTTTGKKYLNANLIVLTGTLITINCLELRETSVTCPSIRREIVLSRPPDMADCTVG